MSDEPTISPEFRAWLDELNAVAKAAGYAGADTFWQDGGADAWRDYFNDDYSPEDAFTEDASYGD